MSAYFSTPSFVAGTVFGVLLAGIGFFSNDLSLFSESPAPSAASDEQSYTSDLISVAAQAAGTEVIIGSVSVPSPGVWLAVREFVGENLGNVLGAARAGTPRTEVVVPLLRATLPGRAYAVELYRDDNNGEFDPAKNSVYIDFDTGERVVVRFSTTE